MPAFKFVDDDGAGKRGSAFALRILGQRQRRSDLSQDS